MDKRDFPLPVLRHRYAGSAWLQYYLQAHKKTEDVILSPFGVVVAELLGFLFNGIYNAKGMVNWERWGREFANPDCIELVISSNGGWSTYDSDTLTHLVLLATLTGIRIEVNPVNQRYFRLYFHRRYSRHLPDQPDLNRIYHTHPTIEQLLANIQQHLNVEWQPAQEATRDPA
jgi:hypothetical protein